MLQAGFAQIYLLLLKAKGTNGRKSGFAESAILPTLQGFRAEDAGEESPPPMTQAAPLKEQYEQIVHRRSPRARKPRAAKQPRRNRKEDLSKKALCEHLSFVTGRKIEPDSLLPGFALRVREKVKGPQQGHLWFRTHTYSFGLIPALIFRPFGKGEWLVFLPLAWVSGDKSLGIEPAAAMTLGSFLELLESRCLPVSSRHGGDET